MNDFPIQTEVINLAKPIYEVMRGWQQDISGIKDFKYFPPNARKYLNRISHLSGVPISIISIGARREQTIFLKKVL